MKRLLSATLLLAAVPAFAQGPGPGGPGFGGPGGPGFHGPGFGLLQPVTNAPYSATFTSTSTEKLQDGTVLTHTSTRVASRDSLGRTREQITFPAGKDGKQHIETVIIDPVAHTVIRLNAEKKTAFVHQIPAPRGDRGPGRRGPGAPPPPAGQAANGEQHGPRDKNVVVADLGSKTLDGVIATGKKSTRTIPANAMGNPAPIVITHETWVSPDLKIELSRSVVDPFRGTDTVAATGLTKAEPDAALFKVPSDYKVEQAPERAGGFRRGPRRGAPDAPPPPPAGV